MIYAYNCFFYDGLAKYGGSIFVGAEAKLTFDKCVFRNNYAQVHGGAIYGSAYRSIIIQGMSKFIDNIALNQGDDIYAGESKFALEMYSISF